jgi:hypothetical protein
VAWKEYDPAVSGPSEFELATPEDSVPVPAEVPVPAQVPLVKKVKTTDPVGVPAPVPDTVAWSVTVDPSGTDVTAAPPIWTVVTVWLAAFVTVSGSQPPKEGE